MLVLSLLTLFSSNFLVWWSVLILTTLVFLAVIKSNLESYGMVKYFVIQEVASLTMGVMILFSLPVIMVMVMVMIKVALAPFHFWVIGALQSLNGWPFSWVITFQKLPGMLMLTQMVDLKGFVLLALGSVLCALQMMATVKPKTIILLSTTVTSSWVVMTMFDGVFNLVFLSAYFLGVALLLNESISEQQLNVEYLFMLVLLSFPLTLMFMFKVAILLTGLKVSVPLMFAFLISTLGATLAYMEILKSYITTREYQFKLLNNKGLVSLGAVLVLLVVLA